MYDVESLEKENAQHKKPFMKCKSLSRCHLMNAIKAVLASFCINSCIQIQVTTKIYSFPNADIASKFHKNASRTVD